MSQRGRHGDAASAPEEHRDYAPDALGCGVLTVSDSRTVETDKSGKLIEEQLVGAGHRVMERAIVPDEAEAIRASVLRLARRSGIDAIIVTGGTGVSPRDVTPEAVASLLDKRLDGFGELFRKLSFEEIGAAAQLSRALAGTIGASVVYVTPGSSGAVRLALERLILPEITHIVGQLRRRD